MNEYVYMLIGGGLVAFAGLGFYGVKLFINHQRDKAVSNAPQIQQPSINDQKVYELLQQLQQKPQPPKPPAEIKKQDVGELMAETNIEREKGYLYFIGKDGNVYRKKIGKS